MDWSDYHDNMSVLRNDDLSATSEGLGYNYAEDAHNARTSPTIRSVLVMHSHTCPKAQVPTKYRAQTHAVAKCNGHWKGKMQSWTKVSSLD